MMTNSNNDRIVAAKCKANTAEYSYPRIDAQHLAQEVKTHTGQKEITEWLGQVQRHGFDDVCRNVGIAGESNIVRRHATKQTIGPQREDAVCVSIIKGILRHAFPLRKVMLCHGFAFEGWLAIQQGYYQKNTDGQQVWQPFFEINLHHLFVYLAPAAAGRGKLIVFCLLWLIHFAMNGQLQKVLIILNTCFWLTVSFALWQHSGGFPQQLVSTVIVLGVLSVLANGYFWAQFWWKRKSRRTPNNWLFLAFIGLSSLAQLYLLIFTRS